MPTPTNSSSSEWYAAALEEYKTLREESLSAVDRQQSIVRFGVALVGTLIGLGIRAQYDTYVGSLVLTIFVPIVVYLILALWLGEVERSVRAGAVVAALECKLGLELAEPRVVLGWERWLRGLGPPLRADQSATQQVKNLPQGKQLFARIRVVVTFFLFLTPGVISAWIGDHTLLSCDTHDPSLGDHCYPVFAKVALAFDVAMLVAIAGGFVWALRHVEELRKPPPVDEVWPRIAHAAPSREGDEPNGGTR